MKKTKLFLLSLLFIFIFGLSSWEFSLTEDVSSLVKGSTDESSSESKESKSAGESSKESSSDEELKETSSENKRSSENKTSSESKPHEESLESTQSSSSDQESEGILSLLHDYKNDYVYQQLGLDSTYGDLMQDAYDYYYDACKEFLVSGSDLTPKVIGESSYNIVGAYPVNNQSDLYPLFSTIAVFVQDNPLFYFLETGYSSYSSSSGSNITYYACILCNDDYLSGSTRNELNDVITTFIDDVNDNMTSVSNDEYHKIKALHNYIIGRIDYSYVTDSEGKTVPNNQAYAHNIIGVANAMGAVCEGYAKCYKLLCDLYDINTIVVTGTAQTSTSSGGHAWNYSMIDDTWYGVDVTWDDQRMKMNQDDYLLVSSSTMAQEHIPYDNKTYGLYYNVYLPTLSSSNYSYIGSVFS